MTTLPLGLVLTRRAAERPDAPAVTCGAQTISRVELESKANRLARAYCELGVGQDGFVTIALPNGIEFVTAMFATWKLGATPAPVSWRLPAPELEQVVELADPTLVVGRPPGSHHDRRCIDAGYEPGDSLSDEPIDPPLVASAWKAPTSGGSTGRPKVIVASSPSQMDLLVGLGFGMREDGVTLVPGPLYHNSPFGMVATALATGNHVVLMEKFDATEALEAIQRYRVDHVTFVPTMMLRILRVLQASPERFDISSLQTVWHMAAPCPEWLKEAWIDLVGADRLFELYGGTESQAVTRISGTEWLDHRGSVGRPWVGDISVLGPDGEPLPPGQVGEIYMRPPHGAATTYRYIGAEAKAIGNWESLGDLGWMDEDGYLYISDRRTDMIVSGGANVYPAEVEAVLMQHADVETAVVVGLPHEDLGQAVHAVVQSSASVSADEILAFVAQQLVLYKVPRSIRIVDHPLRDDAGKVRRPAVREDETRRLAAGQPSGPG